jgi:2-oxoglutarate ferredoxin oxidoreductase subunit alpha
LEWDDERCYDRGKVFSADDLEAMTERFGRYLDLDGDGIPNRTLPGTHPTKGAYFTRGTSRDEYAVYTESGAEYVKNMERLLIKWQTAKSHLPAPIIKESPGITNVGVIYYGSSEASTLEAVDMLAAAGLVLDSMGVKAFPFNNEVEQFINCHGTIFVVEQNRDAQMRSMLIIECEVNPKKLIKVLNYDGSPITARTIEAEVTKALNPCAYIAKKAINAQSITERTS